MRTMFDDLRRQERMHAPKFRLPQPRRAENRPVLRALLTAALVILIVGALILPLRSRRATTDVAAWKAPTDFLLTTPQSNLLRTVPEFGVPSKKGTS
jgi:hypothetical protein